MQTFHDPAAQDERRAAVRMATGLTGSDLEAAPVPTDPRFAALLDAEARLAALEATAHMLYRDARDTLLLESTRRPEIDELDAALIAEVEACGRALDEMHRALVGTRAAIGEIVRTPTSPPSEMTA